MEIGIIGLPNAGKSTLFNALASRKLAETDIRPFTTIDPHEAVVEVPDKYLKKLSDLVQPEKTVAATVTFIDIAGLIKDAHKGEGLGNQFLGKIREVDAIVHVVRAFADPNVTHSHPSHEPGSEKQMIEDIEIVNLELELGGIEKKPTIYVLNVDEADVSENSMYRYIETVESKFATDAIAISAKLEEELIDFGEQEKQEYLEQAGIKETGFRRLIKSSYRLLDLISFYTIKGGKELHAWSIKRGSSALDAAEIVHTDFAKKFIKAEVVSVEKLLGVGSWKLAKEKGLIRLEGKDCIVQNRDVIEFKTGS